MRYCAVIRSGAVPEAAVNQRTGGNALRIIGLTGSIACGKSTVSAWLSEQPGCRIIDGDLLSRELTAPGGSALPAIRSAFGDSFFYPDGTLNRRRLGRLVFRDPQARNTLDELMAPLLEELTRVRLQQSRGEGVTLCFLDFPLLFEKGYDRLCDTVWCVYLPRDLQLRRLMARDGCTEEEALAKMDSVLSSEEKASRSEIVIDNSGEISFTLSLLPPLLEAEYQKAAVPRRRRSGAPGIVPEKPDMGNAAVTAESGSGRSGSDPETMESPGPVMERPAAARKKVRRRKAEWLLPSWLIVLLSVTGFLVLAGFTAQSLMRAYLTRQAEKHLAEQNAIYANYPLVFRGIIEEMAAEYNLNPAFVSAIIRNESSFQPMAESAVGARGLMQLMPDTAQWIAGKLKTESYAFERMYDPESNIRFGCWYLRYLSNLFHGDPVCVSCAYHAGQGQVTAWLSDPNLSPDGVSLNLSRMADGPTKTYAGRVIRTYGIYQALYFESHLPDAGADSASGAGAGQ